MTTWTDLEKAFLDLAAEYGRAVVASAVGVAKVRLLPEQSGYLRRKLAPLGVAETEITAVSIGIAYHPDELHPIPDRWTGGKDKRECWNEYARAYHGLNSCLAAISRGLAEEFGGVAEGPTREGIAGKVSHVRDYFPTCVSHRAFAEAAGLGWRGKHQLIVTPEFGPAFRLATVFIPARLNPRPRQVSGCGECSECVDLCPVLGKGLQEADHDVYREMCRRRIKGLELEADVCGLCVRRCWEVISSVTRRSNGHETL